MDMDISFPGGKKVNASFDGFTVKTDQPKEDGGDGTGASPYDLFLASIGTCAGYYVLNFCQGRKIDTRGLEMKVPSEKNEKTHLLDSVQIEIRLPPEFPEKYKTAVVRAAGLCTVERSLAAPPVIDVTIENPNR